jgi:hypothetical protein
VITKQPLPLQFQGGIETRQDEKQVPATRLLDLQNATFIRSTTLAKRNGYRALGRIVDSEGVNYSDPVGLAVARDTELHLFDGERGLSYRESVDKWADAGPVASVTSTDKPIARTGTTQTTPDHATNGGVTVCAWEDSRGGVWMSIVETESGRLLLEPTQLDADGSRPRCVPTGTVLHVYWANVPDGRIYCAVVNPTLPAALPVTLALTDDLSVTNPSYDACPFGVTDANPLATATMISEQPAIIAWVTALGWRLAYVHPSGVLGSPVTGLPSAATYPDDVTSGIACTYNKTGQIDIGVVFTTATDTVIYLVNVDDLTSSSTDLPSAAGSGTRVAAEFDESTDAGIWWAVEYAGGTPDVNAIITGRMAGSGVVTALADVLRGHNLVGRAFVDDGTVHIPIVHPVLFFPYVAIVRLVDGSNRTVVVARSLPGSSTGELPSTHLPSSHAVTPDAAYLSRKHAITLGYRIQLDSEDGDQFGEAGIKLVSYNFDDDVAYQSATLGRGLYLAGALMAHYDGDQWTEAGFHCAPDRPEGEVISVVGSNGAGSLTPSATYGYKFVYEQIDAQGELHLGPESVQVNVVLGVADDTVTALIPTCRLSSKRRIRIGVFRSPANQTGDPSAITFYRVTSLDPADTSGANRFIDNDPSTDFTMFVDFMSDADLITKEILYTVGGVLSNSPSPMAGAAIAGGKSRLFWTDPSDGNVVRYSQEIRDEYGLESPADLSLQVDPYGGDIVALAVMDDAIYAFKRTAIYVVGGPGPAPAPATSDAAFSPAALVTGDVGCKSPASICQSPIGIMFQSDKGIMLLSRSRQVISIGDPVYAYKDQLITRATLLPDRHQVVFLTDAGRTLLYDYTPDIQQWSTYTNHTGFDAVVVANTYNYLRTDGRVFRETPGRFADDNMHIQMKIETAWIKMTGYLQGFQKVLWALFLGTWKSPHTLRMRYRIDYDEGYSAPIDMEVDSNYNPDSYGAGPYGAGPYGGAGGDTTRYQRAVHLNKRCQSISFKLEDIEDTADFGASFELSELLLIGGVLGPRYPVGAARTS